MAVQLYDYQLEAVNKLKNGSILCGGVGSGKSITALYYYLVKECKGDIRTSNESYDEVPFEFHDRFIRMKTPRDLYIITTAKKRDSLEWDKECTKFCLNKDASVSHSGVKVTIDSWNNIKKYKDVYGAFFIFDEQRVVGSGAWVKTFLNITRKNRWILLSATPGDQWSDYIPVFVANGFYKNKTEFNARHCVFARFAKYPKIERYIGEKTLKEYRDSILIPMKDERQTIRHEIPVIVDYDRELYRTVFRDRWNPYDNEPIQETGKLMYLIRRVVNSNPSRIEKVREIFEEKNRCIIFYNFTYELEMLRKLFDEMEVTYAEWNGERHEPLPKCERWAYLVQYTAGSEGWNCVSTDTIVFFSQSYSFRSTEQASGRIDRINTSYKDLYYYHLRSTAPIDIAIHRALKNKRNFNESSFLRR